MRIRWKLLLFLLVMVLAPLLLARWYSVREAAVTGREIAAGAAETLTRVADRELVQTVDLYGEALADAVGLLDTSLKVLAHEAEDLLGEPAKPGGAVVFSGDFDSGKDIPGKTILHLAPSEGDAQGEDEGKDAPKDIAISFEAPAFRLAPGTPDEDGGRSEEIQRLGQLGSLLKILFQGAQKRILWAYVSLADGVHLTYPGHGGYPEGYDPRQRPWYKDAVRLEGLSWRVMVEAVTRRVVANLSIPLRAPDGRVIGAAGIDAPIGALLPDNDLTLRWSGDMRAVLAKVDAPPGAAPSLSVIAGHDQEGDDWRKPVTPERIVPEDEAAMEQMLKNIDQGRSGVARMPYKGRQSSWAYRPMGPGGGVLLLIVPHAAVTAEAADAEASILKRTNEMISVTGIFTLGAAILVVIMAFSASRVVTLPLRRLAEAAGRVAGGDLDARVPASGGDELADLGRAFNDMVPHLAERLRLKNDLELAMEVQQHLLPRHPPVTPGLDIAGATFFCDETGGDYFDYLAFSGNDGCPLDVIVGDVTGHGISAALFMATGRALMRARACDSPEPGELLTRVNELLCNDTLDSGRFITMFLLRLENGGLAPGGGLRWSRAGHDPALIYDPKTDAFTELMGAGIPLGVDQSWRYEDNGREGLSPGMILAVGTDGIWEAHNAEEEMFGRERFREVLKRNAHRPAREIVEAVVSAVETFHRGVAREDDITLVIIKAMP